MSFEDDLKLALGAVEDEATRTKLITDITKAQIKSEAGLVNKRDELLKETKAQKETLGIVNVKLEAFGTNTPEDIDKLKASNKELLDNPGDEEKFAQQQRQFDLRLADAQAATTKQFDKFKADLREKDEQFQKLDGEINESLKKRALGAALDRVNVSPHFKHDLTRSLLYDVVIDKVGDTRKVKINIDGAPFDIEPGLELWSRDPLNEHYISAAQNIGGGGGGSAGSVTLASKPWNEMTIEEKNTYFDADPAGFYAKRLKATGR